MLPSNPTFEELKTHWRDWIVSQVPTECKVIYAEPISGGDGPRPPKPYITLKIISGPRARGFDELRRKPNSDVFQVGGLRQYTLSIQAFGLGGYDMLGDLVSRMDDPYASVEKSRVVAIVDRGDVVDISSLLETGYETRAALDVIFHAAKNLDTSIKPIERVRIGGTLSQGNQGEQEVGPLDVDKDVEP